MAGFIAVSAPLNYFLHAYGPAAKPTMILGWVFGAVCSIVCIIIALLLLMAILRHRSQAKYSEICQGNGGVRWIYIGTGISVVILFAMMLYALVILNEVATPPAKPEFTITVTGYDWWWKVEYENADASKRIVTANEIHIPVGVPVLVKLKSADVIHAFWVPALAGKTQMIPGLTNEQWIKADVAGVYYGKCTQFCGLQHAHMDFEVVAESAEDFKQWEAAERLPATIPSEAAEKKGATIFMNRCSACHTIKGTSATGEHGPDLTHLGARRLIAAGLLTNTPEHVMDWVAHAQELKPGVRMPNTYLAPAESTALSAYLSTLK